MREHVNVTFDPYVIEIPSLDVTFKAAQGAATIATAKHLRDGNASLDELDPDWRPKFSVKYRGVIIGQLRLKTARRAAKYSTFLT